MMTECAYNEILDEYNTKFQYHFMHKLFYIHK